MVIVANFCSETQAPQGAEIIILELALLFLLEQKLFKIAKKFDPKNIFIFQR